MTDSELQGIGAQALNMAKREMKRGYFNFLLAAYHTTDTPPLHRMTQIEAILIERLGEGWLNSDAAKDRGFFLLRIAVSILPPDAVVMVTKALALEGSPIKGDILHAIVQTPERFCIYGQKLDTRGEPTGTPVWSFGPLDAFEGRLKLFGAEIDDKALDQLRSLHRRSRN
jgi:hypothetical protein